MLIITDSMARDEPKSGPLSRPGRSAGGVGGAAGLFTNAAGRMGPAAGWQTLNGAVADGTLTQETECAMDPTVIDCAYRRSRIGGHVTATVAWERSRATFRVLFAALVVGLLLFKL